jgi:hypothetical protein
MKKCSYILLKKKRQKHAAIQLYKRYNDCHMNLDGITQFINFFKKWGKVGRSTEVQKLSCGEVKFIISGCLVHDGNLLFTRKE